MLLWSLGQWRLGSLGRRRWLRVSGLFDGEWYSRGCRDSLLRDLDPLFHYLTLGWKQGLLPAPGFSVDRYQWLLKEQGLSPGPRSAVRSWMPLTVCRALSLELQALQMLIDRSVPLSMSSVERRPSPLTLVGAFGSATGLGQASRNLAYALDAAGCDVRFHDLPMAGPLVDTEFATKCSRYRRTAMSYWCCLSRAWLSHLCVACEEDEDYFTRRGN